MCDAMPHREARTYFMVEARAGDGVRAWVSPPDSFGSVDNIAPPPPPLPEGTYSAGTVTLRWGRSAVADVEAYYVYRERNGGFSGQTTVLMGIVTDTTWAGQVTLPCWFQIVAKDEIGRAHV